MTNGEVRRQDSNLNHAGLDALQPFPWKLPHIEILGLFMKFENIFTKDHAKTTGLGLLVVLNSPAIIILFVPAYYLFLLGSFTRFIWRDLTKDGFKVRLPAAPHDI